jgi:hypothetical protein
MQKVLTEVCEFLNNYFWRQKINVKLTIEDGTFTLPTLKEGQYFRILGSTFNDGVHKYPATDLVDETFEGQIWSMAVPQTVIDLTADIKKWQDKYGAGDSEAMSPYSSESFGNYSYSKSTTGNNGSMYVGSWQDVFASRLNKWRRLRNI